MNQEFWSRWTKEYISELQQRYRWKIKQHNLKTGELVIVKEDNLPPLLWLYGRVEKLYAGKDGVIRVVDVKNREESFAILL